MTQTFKQFASRNNIDMDILIIPARSDGFMNDSAVHFHVTLTTGGNLIKSFYYSCGALCFDAAIKRNWNSVKRVDKNNHGHGPIIKSYPEFTRLAGAKLTERGQEAFNGIAREAARIMGQKALNVEDVLNSLAMDSMGADESFSDWADNYGYDTDSIKAKKIYDSCVETMHALKNSLGYAKFNELLECEE